MTAHAPPVPTPGLIASLHVRLWLDHTADGRQFAPLLITHPPARRTGEDAATIEARMRGVAEAIGASPPGPLLPESGPRLTVHGAGLLLVHLDGTPHALRLHQPARRLHVLAGLGQVLLAVGLDPLGSHACGAAVDRYVEAAGEAGRVCFAAAGVLVGGRWGRGRLEVANRFGQRGS
ncbi:hypothetical protein [Streptomyces xiaopingdaonensis]|uniref:hypothetical protein n=1 Tax=Streptomyces xiaopingdaonensis TaxID=1565415 RepID=UPI0003183002|nr:hypothetical protein [Streptomyces xiaopingdaonensis]